MLGRTAPATDEDATGEAKEDGGAELVKLLGSSKEGSLSTKRPRPLLGLANAAQRKPSKGRSAFSPATPGGDSQRDAVGVGTPARQRVVSESQARVWDM